jgi:hypothetical protein
MITIVSVLIVNNNRPIDSDSAILLSMGYRLPSVCRRTVEASTRRSSLEFSPFIGVTGRPTCANCHQFRMGFYTGRQSAISGG